MRETERFINEARGWECKRCRAAEAEASRAEALGPGAEAAAASEGGALAKATPSPALPRFFREGEAEEREARLSARALARWKDDARRALVCPRCGAEEDLRD